ncbi:free fatty acid receptor 3-like [Neoarius graeffei]|uniref:free fatty acid receptor 3-like n=1 Tax=Neoarius graeffei TaxID=443677 RepID=UPI00298BD083|nr:free fatty acid receptor 3-like [Neoarius graeffei]XP_060756314.1 free fatty acid receptor 3-like [Neoarius graeffei]XP_060756315.1 free fatty acid receptor 3-like [Neoarius graeffei]
MLWTEGLSNLVLVVDGIILIAGFPANLLALYTFVQKVKQQAMPIDVLLLSLTISDLIFLFFLTFRMKEAADMKWIMSYFLCPLSGFFFYTTIYNSTLHLTAISVERYLGVAFPIKYKLKRHPRNAVIASVIFWVVSMAHCSIVYIMQYYRHKNENVTNPVDKDICYDMFSKEQLTILLPVRLELFIVLFCIPLIICCFCYIRFIHILSRLPNIKPKKRSRAIGLALATLLVFIICFLPYNVSHLVGYIISSSPDWRVYALIPSTLNACLDPFVYYFSSSALRGTLKRLIYRGNNRQHTSCCRRLLNCPQLNCIAHEESTQGSNDISY